MLLLHGGRLGEGEGGVSRAVLRGTLLGLEAVLASEGSSLVAEVGLSVAVVAGAAAVAVAVAPVASVLCVCAKGFIWSVVIPSIAIPVSKTAKIAPSRIPIPAIISVVPTSASP